MKRSLLFGLMVCLLAGMFCLAPMRAEATTFSELTTIYETQLVPTTMATIDGVQIEYFVDFPVVGERYIFDLTNGVLIYQGPHNKDLELQLLAQHLGIPMFTAGSIGTPDSAAATTSNLVFENLVVPTVAPKTEQKRVESQKQTGKVRVFGGRISVDWVDIDDGADEGNVYNFSAGFAMDSDNVTVGVIIPYDRLDFDSFDGNRIGVIPYAQYHLDVTDALRADLSANLNFMYSDYQFDSGGDEDINTYGGGLSAGLRYVQENYEAGCGVSWQYNEDNVDLDDDHQDLIKLGANFGVHVTENQVVNVFGVWNKDVTNYHADFGDDDYFDLGVEYRADFSGTWTMNLGYKKIVDLDDYDSDMIYIGSSWLF